MVMIPRAPERSPGDVLRGVPIADLRFVRALVAFAFLMSWVVAQDHREAVLDGFGVALVVVMVLEGAAALRLREEGRLPALVRAAAPGCAAMVILLDPSGDVARLAPAAGSLLVVRGVADVLAAIRVGRRLRLLPWFASLGAAELAIGLASVGLTDLFGQAAIVLVGFGWLGGGVTAFVSPVDGEVRSSTTAPVARAGTMPAEERARIADEVFFDGAYVRERLTRFLVLLTIATVIATYGVLGNSVASVIGAMIVAPLMLPIQALTAALVAGVTRQATTAVLVLLGGVALVFFLSMFLASTFRDLDFVLLYDQVTSRTAPALTDLAVALGAGAAGGYALLRKDVADSLPGVAVAISLVPPICVSGAETAGGNYTAAAGAFLLFSVNFVAIVIASGAVLVLGGFGVLADRDSRRVLTAGAAFAVAAAALAVPLALTGLDSLESEGLEGAARSEVVRWLGPVEPADVLDLRVEGDVVTVLVASAARPPSAQSLEESVRDVVGRDVSVEVHWLPARTLE